MESPIKDLLDKYWAGETTLDEEARIKAYFRENPSLTADGQYFRQLDQIKQSSPASKLQHPGKSRNRVRWSVAAAIIVGLSAALLVLEDARQQDQFEVEDPKEALEITRKALMMVSSGLNEGKTYSAEITKINKAEELIQEN